MRDSDALLGSHDLRASLPGAEKIGVRDNVAANMIALSRGRD